MQQAFEDHQGRDDREEGDNPSDWTTFDEQSGKEFHEGSWADEGKNEVPTLSQREAVANKVGRFSSAAQLAVRLPLAKL
jgi:hypothetical protein